MKFFEYQTKQKIKVTYVFQPQFQKSYCGIACAYGGKDSYVKTKDFHRCFPAGLAHFIEHKLFSMPDQKDAFVMLSKMNVDINAYTAVDKTLYFFSTTEKIEAPLKLLLQMYFTPHFTEEEIEHEKKIIFSEIEMYEDKKENVFHQKLLEALYPGDPFSFSIAGSKESVERITLKDLSEAYEYFYTPQNSRIVVVSHEEKEKVFQWIEEALEPLSFSSETTEKTSAVYSLKPSSSFHLNLDFSQEHVEIGIRFTEGFQDSLFCHWVIGIFECLFSVLAPFETTLRKEKLLIGELDYVVTQTSETAYATIDAISDQSRKLFQRIEHKLKNLSKKDFHFKILNLYIKQLKAQEIVHMDSIEGIGDEILNLSAENGSYFEDVERIRKMKEEDFEKALPAFRTCEMIYASSEKVKS